MNDTSASKFNLVLMISLILVAILCAQYFFKTRELRNLQGTATAYQNKKAMLNLLVNDVLEYSKSNPAIDPILQAAGAKPGKASTTAPAPTKPASK